MGRQAGRLAGVDGTPLRTCVLVLVVVVAAAGAGRNAAVECGGGREEAVVVGGGGWWVRWTGAVRGERWGWWVTNADGGCCAVLDAMLLSAQLNKWYT